MVYTGNFKAKSVPWYAVGAKNAITEQLSTGYAPSVASPPLKPLETESKCVEVSQSQQLEPPYGYSLYRGSVEILKREIEVLEL